MVMLILQDPKAGANDVSDDLGKWIALAPPEKGSAGWLAANHDVEHEWVVTLRDGRPHAEVRDRKLNTSAPLPFEIQAGTAREGLAGRRFVARVSDGWIVAYNAGEFGAGLWWFSPDGTRRDKIAEAWVNGFIPTPEGLLAVEGIAHGTISRGRILRLTRDPAGRWKAEDLVDLGHAPQVAVKAADGSILVATTDRLLRVAPADKTITVLLEGAFWGGLYPGSLIVTPDGSMYLGMRHCVARVEKKGGRYQTTWLVPNRAFADLKAPEGLK